MKKKEKKLLNHYMSGGLAVPIGVSDKANLDAMILTLKNAKKRGGGDHCHVVNCPTRKDTEHMPMSCSQCIVSAANIDVFKTYLAKKGTLTYIKRKATAYLKSKQDES